MKIRIDDIPQNISIKEIVLDIQVHENSFKVQSINTVESVKKDVSKTSEV